MDQKRPYLGLDDAARFIAFTIENQLFDNKLYNVLTKNFTVRDVVDTIKEFVPDLQIQLVDHKIMNQLSYEVSSARIGAKGFSFNDNLRDKIEETIHLLHPRQKAVGEA